MKKFNEIYAEALKNEELRNELTQAVAEKKLADFLKAHDCDSDIEEIRDFLTEQQAKAQRGDIELNIDDLEDVAGGANRFIATLLAGLSLATAMTPVAAAAAEEVAAPAGYVTEVDMDDDTIDFDIDLDDKTAEIIAEKADEEAAETTTEAELETVTTTAAEAEFETTTTTAFEEVALPTTEEDKEDKEDTMDVIDKFINKQLDNVWKLGKKELAKRLPDLTKKIFDSVPGVNILNKIGLGKKVGNLLVSALGLPTPESEPSTKDIMNKLEEVIQTINDAKVDINAHSDSNLAVAMKSFENIEDKKTMAYGVQLLSGSFSDLYGKYNECIELNASDSEKLVQLAAVCGSASKWSDAGTFVFSLVNVGNYISGQKNFVSNQTFMEKVFEVAMTHGAVYSGQVLNEVEPYLNDVMETYMAAYSLAMASLDAQDALVAMLNEGVYDEFLSTLNPDMQITCKEVITNRFAIASKKKELAQILTDVTDSNLTNNVLAQYEKALTRSAHRLIDKGEASYQEGKEVELGSASIICDDAEESADRTPYTKVLSYSSTTRMREYAKKHGMSLAEAFEDARFEIPENTRYVLTSDKISKERKHEYKGDNVYGVGVWDDYYTVKAIDIYDVEQKEIDVQIKHVHIIARVENGDNQPPSYTVETSAVNFLTFTEKTDTSVSVIGKVVKDNYLISNGDYKLEQDMNIEKPIVVQSGTNATIDLNGFALNCTDNSAPAITVESGAKLTITDSSEGKTGKLKGYTKANGGAVLVKKAASCTIENITIAGSASNNGGAVYNEGTARIENCVLDNNGGTSNGGAVVNYGDITITETKISRCKTDGAGGAVRNYGTCNVDHTSITECTAKDGGAFYNKGTLTMTDITMSNNKTTSQGGGAVSNHGKLSITGFEIKNNTSEGNGGAIWSETSVYLKTGTMDGNKSNSTGGDNGGGAVYMKKGTLEIHDATISNNSCNSDGGAIMCDSGSSTIKAYNTDFTGNYAPSDGGAIKTKADNEFRNCTFTKNSCGNKGGAIDLASSAKGNFYACTIEDNTAPKGSAIRYDSHAKYSFNEGTQVTGVIY